MRRSAWSWWDSFSSPLTKVKNGRSLICSQQVISDTQTIELNIGLLSGVTTNRFECIPFIFSCNNKNTDKQTDTLQSLLGNLIMIQTQVWHKCMYQYIKQISRIMWLPVYCPSHFILDYTTFYLPHKYLFPFQDRQQLHPVTVKQVNAKQFLWAHGKWDLKCLNHGFRQKTSASHSDTAIGQNAMQSCHSSSRTHPMWGSTGQLSKFWVVDIRILCNKDVQSDRNGDNWAWATYKLLDGCHFTRQTWQMLPALYLTMTLASCFEFFFLLTVWE